MATIREDGLAAKELGLATFHSSVKCNKCGGTERYTKPTHGCVNCNRLKSAKNYEESKMAKDRRFEKTSEVIGEKRVGVYVVECNNCHKPGKLTPANAAGTLPHDIIAQKMRQRGWEIGKKDGEDKCPECLKLQDDASRAAHAAKHANKIPHVDTTKEEPMTEQPHTVPTFEALVPATDFVSTSIAGPTLRADPPRDMTKIERRTIWLAIEAAYGDEKTGYKEPYTDKLIAEELGTRVGFVRTIREQNFGIERPAIDVQALTLKLEDIGNKHERLNSQVTILRERHGEIVAEASKHARMLDECSIRSVAIDDEIKTVVRDGEALAGIMFEMRATLSKLEAR